VVSRDGQRFLFNAAEDAESTPITVMVNWLAAKGSGGSPELRFDRRQHESTSGSTNYWRLTPERRSLTLARI
jgi:hypothetical protein